MNIGTTKINAEYLVKNNIKFKIKIIKLTKLKILLNIGAFFIKLVCMIFPCKVEVEIVTEVDKVDTN